MSIGAMSIGAMSIAAMSIAAIELGTAATVLAEGGDVGVLATVLSVATYNAMYNGARVPRPSHSIHHRKWSIGRLCLLPAG